MCSYPHLRYHFDQYELDCCHRDTPREVHEQRFAGSSFAHHLLQSNTNSQASPLANAQSRALSLLRGTAPRYRIGAAFSSPSPIVLITVLYFSAIAIFQALVERFAFLDYANSLQDVRYLFGLNNDCLALCLASPPNAGHFVLGKRLANVALWETRFPLFIVGVRCPCCHHLRSDTGE